MSDITNILRCITGTISILIILFVGGVHIYMILTAGKDENGKK